MAKTQSIPHNKKRETEAPSNPQGLYTTSPSCHISQTYKHDTSLTAIFPDKFELSSGFTVPREEGVVVGGWSLVHFRVDVWAS